MEFWMFGKVWNVLQEVFFVWFFLSLAFSIYSFQFITSDFQIIFLSLVNIAFLSFIFFTHFVAQIFLMFWRNFKKRS